MNEYMITIELPRQMNREFLDLIPEQRARVNALVGAGIITSYALSLDRRTLWTTIVGTSEEDITGILNSFPIRGYIRFEITPIAFRQASHTTTQLFLN